VPAVTGDGRRRRRRWRLHILEWGGDRGRREKGLGEVSSDHPVSDLSGAKGSSQRRSENGRAGWM
jgi:hypothetical protein